jgi:hypothetical protein
MEFYANWEVSGAVQRNTKIIKTLSKQLRKGNS